jgi:hypothetical protein
MPDGVIHVWEPGAEGHGLQRRTARNGAPTGSQPFFTWGDVRFHVQERNGSPQGVIVDLVYLGGRGKDRFGTATALSFSVYSEALKWDGDAAGSGRP